MPGKAKPNAKRARTPIEGTGMKALACAAGGEPRKQKHKRAPGVEQHMVSLPPPLSVSLPPPRRPLRYRGLSLRNYHIQNGQVYGIPQAIRAARIGGFDLMILTETNITDQ